MLGIAGLCMESAGFFISNGRGAAMSAERIFISEGVRKEEFIFCVTASLFAGALYLYGMNTHFAGFV